MTGEGGKGRCYVDNAMNRSLGRVGMPRGSMVISSKGSGASSSSASCFGDSQSDGGGRYVDNYFNRGLGRVGMPKGSMVVPSRGNSSYPLRDSNICLPSSYSEQTYVDSYMNHRLGHFGRPLGSTVVYSRENRENSLFDDNDIHRRSLESGRSYEDHWMKKYIDQIDQIIESKAESSKESNELYPSRDKWDASYARSLDLANARRKATDTIQWLEKFLEDESKSASESCTASSSIPKSNEDNKYNQGLGGVSRSEACLMTEFRKDRSTFSPATSRESSASSHKVSDNVDSPLNRNRKRIDMPFGSKPVSKPKSRSSSSPKTSVDNEYNRTLGKKGVKHDSMVVSKDSGTASFKETKQYTDNSKSKSSSSCKLYVDNEYNKDLGREGLKHGSIVESKDSGIAGSKKMDQYVGLEHDSMVESKDLEFISSTGMKHYVDNSTNRRLRRVGLPEGANAKEVRPYKDNLSNRRLGRDRQPVGVAVQSNSGSLEPKFYVDNAHNRRLRRVGYPLGSRPYGLDSEEVVYKDNLSNRKLERAELPRGTAVQSKSRNLKLKFYADNAKNRRLGRVTYPLGCKPEGSFTGSKRTYCDNYLNRQLGRVGKELGTEPMICRKKMEWLHKAYQQCRENPVRTIYIIIFFQHKNFSILISNLVCCIILFY